MSWYHCERCDRWFETNRALWQHEDNSNAHNICVECNIDFLSAWALTQHYVQSSRHSYCQKCDRHFDSRKDLRYHYEDDHYYCPICPTVLDFELGLHEHRRQKHPDLYCVPCKRMFQSENNLRQHQRSVLHQGRTVACPMKNCDRAFVSMAALVLHLESGTCTSGMTRSMVDDIISKFDKRGVITNPSRLITVPTSSSRVTGTWATERAFNGMQYECYLCHRMYASLQALNSHLRSPAHGDKLYRCPNGWHGCESQFRTLSAFLQHVESGQCGVYRFKSQMEKYIDGLSRSARRLTAS